VEWLEGNSLVEVHRILAGQPLYPAPTVGYVADGSAEVAGVLVLAQSALLLSGFHLSQAIRASADRAVDERLIASMRALGGTVAVPADPGLSLLAGMAPAARRFSAIITDGTAKESRP
jgi:hypothetical protein